MEIGIATAEIVIFKNSDGDNIWETTITLLSGSYEYYFTADNILIEETLSPNETCTNGNPNATRRVISISNQNVILPTVCWSSCSECNDFPQPPTGVNCTRWSSFIGLFRRL